MGTFRQRPPTNWWEHAEWGFLLGSPHANLFACFPKTAEERLRRRAETARTYLPERMEFVKISRLSKSLAIRLYRSASLRFTSFIMS
jgi:hypothetical protein